MLCERAGTSKAGGWIDYASLEIALRDDLDAEGAARDGGARSDPPRAHQLGRDLRQRRRTASRATRRRIRSVPRSAARVQPRPGAVDRARRLRRSAGQGLLPPLPRQQGAPQVRLRRRMHRLREGRRRRRHARCSPRSSPTRAAARRAPTRSRSRARSPGSPSTTRLPAEVRLYDRLFSEPQPDAGGKDFKASLNPGQQAGRRRLRRARRSRRRSPATASSSSATATSSPTCVDHGPARPVFNRTATLRDTWSR